MVRDFLKKERFDAERSETFNVPGIATGLAVTSVGGDILYVEASRMPGKGRLSLTGQLGERDERECGNRAQLCPHESGAVETSIRLRLNIRMCTSTFPPVLCPKTARRQAWPWS
jgi:hypothetical protein